MKLWPRSRVRRALLVLMLLLVAAGAALGVIGYRIMWMPGWSYGGTLPAMSSGQVELRERLKKHIDVLATQIGERNAGHIDQYKEAEKYISRTWPSGGAPFKVFGGAQIGRRWIMNEGLEIRGTGGTGQIVIVG